MRLVIQINKKNGVTSRVGGVGHWFSMFCVKFDSEQVQRSQMVDKLQISKLITAKTIATVHARTLQFKTYCPSYFECCF